MQAPDEDFTDIEFKCPQCGAAMERFRETCPDCGHELSDEFCATFRPPLPRAVRLIALILLAGVVLMALVLLLGPLLF
jgi:predicted amidophosphoribosyltransferase